MDVKPETVEVETGRLRYLEELFSFVERAHNEGLEDDWRSLYQEFELWQEDENPAGPPTQRYWPLSFERSNAGSAAILSADDGA